tara:strand:- start:845 stop:1027 length:183 start_codon:yes stop_codon:yes gene_type:complete
MNMREDTLLRLTVDAREQLNKLHQNWPKPYVKVKCAAILTDYQRDILLKKWWELSAKWMP